MKNYLKSIVFHCRNPKYRSLDGRVRYWHVVKRQCYPKGCIDKKGLKYAPELQVGRTAFEEFEKEYREFRKWAQKLEHKRRTAFIGIVHRILPYLEIALVGDTLFYNLQGYLLAYRECLIDNVFYEDRVYVIIKKEWLEKIALYEGDTVSGSGHLQMDERGIITFESLSDLKRVVPGAEYSKPQPVYFDQFRPRAVDYLWQDKCMSCDRAMLVTMWKQSLETHVNQLCCLLQECNAGELL